MPDRHDKPTGGAGDTPMTRTYVNVIVVEAVIIVLLWILGRMYS
jgi:hypothetical protein